MAEIRVGPDPALEKLMILRDLTTRTGVLHELQVKQLRMWPIAIINATSSVCEFCFESKTVKFKISGFHQGKEPTNLLEGLGYLERCVHFLLGPDYGVSVYMKGKKLGSAKSTNRRRKKTT